MMASTKLLHLVLVTLLADFSIQFDPKLEDEPPIIQAVKMNNIDELHTVLKNITTDINVYDAYGLSALMIAAFREYIPIFDELVNNGADVNALTGPTETTTNNNSVLHWALSGTSKENATHMIYTLIKANATLDIAIGGWTPTKLALYFNYFDAAKLLLDAGADVNFVNDNGESYAMFLAQTQKKEALQLISHYCPNMSLYSQADETALSIANKDMKQFVIDADGCQYAGLIIPAEGTICFNCTQYLCGPHCKLVELSEPVEGVCPSVCNTSTPESPTQVKKCSKADKKRLRKIIKGARQEIKACKRKCRHSHKGKE